MCGICGQMSFKQQIRDAVISKMTNVMQHRGPDCGRIYISPNKKIGLGHRRLSIIDLSSNAIQPMTNECKTVWLVCNGEIYNYKTLRAGLERKGHKFRSKSDNEVIIHLYEDHGIDLLHKLDGDFAFGLWDERKKKLYIARDRLGIKPCFYYKDSSGLLFASEMKSLLQYPTISREIDLVALHHYLTFLSIPAPFTIYKEIKKLLPGYYLSVDENEVVLNKYWCLDEIYNKPFTNKDEKEYLEEFSFLLKKAIKKRLMSDVPLGVFLSGGVDSSTIVALMSEIVNPVKTFSIVFGNKYTCDESIYSRKVANLFKTDHHEYVAEPKIFNKLPEIINHFDEPFAIPSAVPLYFLSRYASHTIKVALTGDGGDELFAGYPRYYWDQIVGMLNSAGFGSTAKVGSYVLSKIPRSILPRTLSKAKDLIQKLLLSVSIHPDSRYLLYFTFLTEDIKHFLYSKGVKEQLNDINSVAILEHYYKEITKKDSLVRRTYGDIKTTLSDEMLTKADRMAMVHSIENRVPLLDQELVEFSSQLPSSFKLRNRTGKYIIKKAMSGKLPSRILYRRKGGFNVPLGYWLRNELKWLISEYLNKQRIKKEKIFDPEAIASLVKEFIDKNANLEYHLFPLIVFEIWYDECYR